MQITWYGHRCVRLEAKEGSVLVDPYDPKAIGLRGPVIKDDVVLLSAYEQPRAVMERINPDAFIAASPGEYEKKGVAIRGILAHQDSQNGRELGLCTIWRMTIDDITLCHLGALGAEKLTDQQMEDIGDPDILIVPVGGQSALDPKAAAALATQIEPKIIIPVQFALPDASYSAEKLDKFVKEIGLPVQKEDTLRIQKKQLPVDQTLLIALKA
jgi:L-ascorbate metabolism protein UlaG (beta-lactamase superfamily)